MIKVVVQSNNRPEKEMKFKDVKKALNFMYMCNTKGMFIIAYYGESEYDDIDIYWLNNRVDITKLNTLARNYYRKEEAR